jgi:hypothetical protein
MNTQKPEIPSIQEQIDVLRSMAGDFRIVKLGLQEPGMDYSWDRGQVVCWYAAEALERQQKASPEPKPRDEWQALEHQDWLARVDRATTPWHAAKKLTRREAWFVTRAKDGRQWWHESNGNLVLYRTAEAAQVKADELNASEV